jgi:hypothetical protein
LIERADSLTHALNETVYIPKSGHSTDNQSNDHQPGLGSKIPVQQITEKNTHHRGDDEFRPQSEGKRKALSKLVLLLGHGRLG